MCIVIADVLSTQFVKCRCLCFSKVNDRTAVMVATTSRDMEITEEEAIMVDGPTADTVRITRGTTKGTADTTKGTADTIRDTADTIRDTVEDLDTSTVNLQDAIPFDDT